MTRRSFAFALLLLASCVREPRPAPSTSSPPQRAQRLAFVHVTVVDVLQGIAQPDRAIVIEGDRIAAVMPSAELKAEAIATVIDAQGAFAIPGLWDMHVHFAEPAWAKLYVANGVTGVRVMWGNWHLAPGLAAREHDAPDAVGDRLHFEMRDAFEQGRAVGPHMVISSDIIDGPDSAWPHSVVAKDASTGRAAVDAAKQAGADFIKVYSRLPRDAYLAIADESRTVGLPFEGHVPDSVSVAEASDAGQKSIEHLDGLFMACSSRAEELAEKQATFLKSNRPAADFWHFRTELTIDAATSFDPARGGALFKTFVKNGTWHCPTLSVSRAGGWLTEPSKLGMDDRLAYVPAPFKKYWNPSVYPPARNRTPAEYAAVRTLFDRRLAMVGAMNRAGVSLLAGTDETNPYCFAGFGLHDELGWLVRAGLSPAEALRTATSNPARFFGHEDQEGAIQRGMRADLVILDANPLVDIENTRRIRAVVLRGRLFDRGALNELLSDVKTDVARR
jgi:imidazolonepropionase-like amidohydrolase